MITDFKDKKLVDYLEPGQKVLTRFGHGLGDTILFMPVFWKLRELYPKVRFDLYVESGQEQIWPSVTDKDAPGYDHVFSLNFPMSEGSGLSKPAKCCVDEVGIDPITETAILPICASPFVALHFQGTALPDSVNCPQDVAQQIWAEVRDFGKIPFECHYKHIFHNPRNFKYQFVDNTARQCKADLQSLFGLVQHSWAFIGVASGPFIVALSTMPKRTLYLQKNHKLTSYTEKEIAFVDVNSYIGGTVRKWLDKLD